MSITTQLQQLLRTLLPDKGFKTAGHHRDAIIAGVEEAKTYTDEKVLEVNGYTDQEVSELKTYTDTGLDATVKKTGDETIGGVKTFTSSPVVPDATLPQHPVTLGKMNVVSNNLRDLRLAISYQSQMTNSVVINDKYINTTGQLSSYAGYKINVFNVEYNQIINIAGYGVGSTRLWAIYSDENLTIPVAVSNDLGGAGITINDTFECPVGSLKLAIVNFTPSATTISASIYKYATPTIITNNSGIIEITDSYIAMSIPHSSANNLIVKFKKCGKNNLMQIYSVGFKANSGYLQSPSVVPDMIINESFTSDNIGPLSVYDAGFVGGNHGWYLNGAIPTAETESYEIYVDGYKQGTGIYSFERAAVKVVNKIYDPKDYTGSILNKTRFVTETVTYTIEKNTITVSLQAKLHVIRTLNLYYGLQSNFKQETHIMTPNGLHLDWVVPVSTNLSKDTYPNFNRFIEKKSGAYQATYLTNHGNGNHSETNTIYRYSNAKSYHQVFGFKSGSTMQIGDLWEWSGSYIFFDSAIIDDIDCIAYTARIRGNDYLFIEIKRPFSSKLIPLPSDLILKDYSVIESVGTPSVINKSTGLIITATANGSIVLRY